MADRTANERLRDAFIRHQVEVQRMSATTRRRFIAMLDQSEADMRAEIARRLAGIATTGDISPGTAALRRLEFLEDALARIRGSAMGEAFGFLDSQLEDLARHSAEFAANQINESSPTVLDAALPAPELLRAIIDSQPFQGKVLSDWAERVAAEDLNRINDAIRIGMVSGEGSDEIGRRVFGTTTANGADGALQVTRNQADSIARTAVNHVSNSARMETFQENSDVLQGVMFVATLDDRTSEICASLDGTVWDDPADAEEPPVHFNCRSTLVPIVDADKAGDRPMKESTEGDLVEEYAQKNDIEIEGKSIRDNLPRGTKGDFDDFARGRVRELTGRTPGTTTYGEFLGRQSVAFQNEVLGVTKARLFRDGGLELRKFVSKRSDTLNLDELSRRYAEAFRQAGLDPKAYR